MDNEQVERIFGSLGRIEAKVDGLSANLTTHTEDDKRIAKALFDRIEPLQASANKQKGALTVLGMAGSMLGAGVGYLVERFLRGH
jgi:hypothetical protein